MTFGPVQSDKRVDPAVQGVSRAPSGQCPPDPDGQDTDLEAGPASGCGGLDRSCVIAPELGAHRVDHWVHRHGRRWRRDGHEQGAVLGPGPPGRLVERPVDVVHGADDHEQGYPATRFAEVGDGMAVGVTVHKASVRSGTDRRGRPGMEVSLAARWIVAAAPAGHHPVAPC